MKYFLTLSIFLFSIMVSAQTVNELVDAGYEKYIKAEYLQAIEFFNKAEKMDSQNPEIFYLRAVCKSLMKKNEDAIKDFDKAISLDKNYAEAWFERGYSWFMLENFNKAIDDYTQAIKIDPEYAEAYQNRGSVRCSINDKTGANADWQKAKELGLQVPYTECL